MEIYIGGKRAALKEGTSFEYIAENRLFSGSDSYTLTITFPLNGCTQNIAIFGHINRKDVIAGKVIFDCEIRDKAFYKFGSITITEINDSEVKTQFLEGRSEQNFNTTFDDIYINELNLGSSAGVDGSTPAKAWSPANSNFKCVALPWVNDYSGNIQNLAEWVWDNEVQRIGHYQWHEDCVGRSWQPYLLHIVKAICEADGVGYDYDFSKWEANEEYRYLLVCNTLPYAWDVEGFARALPHWTVKEFFEKLELFLGGEFTIDHRGRFISFEFTDDAVSAVAPVRLDSVIDEHSVEVTVEEEKCEYQQAKNLVYKECDHEMWKFYSCDWYVKTVRDSAVRYNSMRELLADCAWMRSWDGASGRSRNADQVLYAADVDAYFIRRSLSKTLTRENPSPMINRYTYKMELRPINLFGGRIVDDSEDAKELEIEFVPAWIDETEDKYGKCLFLAFSGYDDNEAVGTSIRRPGEYREVDLDARKKEIDETLFQPHTVQALMHGAYEQKSEYYDRIYVAWWDGALPTNTKLPHPYVEDIEIEEDWSGYRNVHFSLRINNALIKRGSKLHNIDPKQKMIFKFLSDTIPNPRAVFYIQGKRYLCEKITATFTENGMSQLLKGNFYPIID